MGSASADGLGVAEGSVAVVVPSLGTEPVAMTWSRQLAIAVFAVELSSLRLSSVTHSSGLS